MYRYVCTYTHTNTCIYIYIQICVYTCTSPYIYVHTYIYIYTYIQQSIVRLFTQSGEPFTISSLLIAGFTYIFMMLLTYGCAIPAGLFMPSVMVGGCLGRAVGQLVKFYVQDSVFSGAYALAGVLQCVAVCCNVLHCIAVSSSPYSVARMRSRRCVAVLLQGVAGCCIVQNFRRHRCVCARRCVAMCCSL